MKKIFQILFPALALIFILSGCANMRGPAVPEGPPRNLFVGKWTITDITYDNLADSAAAETAFDQAPPRDFKGSNWEFKDSGDGSYTLANGASQNIAWSVNSGDALGAIFQFKKVNQGQSAKDVATGYQLVISKNMGTYMILKKLSFLGNKNGYVVYTFTKTK